MMVVKKYYKELLTVAGLTLTFISVAQNDGAKKEQQVSNLKEIVRHNASSEESLKAKQMLNELQNAPQQTNAEGNHNSTTGTPKKTQHELNYEEQKRASESLSPEEYDTWKMNKAKSIINQPSAQ